MAAVTFSPRTIGGNRFPAAERLVVEFIPSSTAHTDLTVFPRREIPIELDDTDFASVDLATTLNMRPETWYEVRFEWFGSPHPVTGERSSLGWAAMPGRLRVPEAGGSLGQLMDTPAPPGTIAYSVEGPPGDDINNVIYLDNSGMLTGLWLPAGTVGI